MIRPLIMMRPMFKTLLTTNPSTTARVLRKDLRMPRLRVVAPNDTTHRARAERSSIAMTADRVLRCNRCSSRLAGRRCPVDRSPRSGQSNVSGWRLLTLDLSCSVNRRSAAPIGSPAFSELALVGIAEFYQPGLQ